MIPDEDKTFSQAVDLAVAYLWGMASGAVLTGWLILVALR